jgi:hypothetical protein
MDSVAAEHGVCKGVDRLAIQRVEDTLVKDGVFASDGKKVLKRKSESIRRIAANVTENSINRPKNGRKTYYSGKNVIR